MPRRCDRSIKMIATLQAIGVDVLPCVNVGNSRPIIDGFGPFSPTMTEHTPGCYRRAGRLGTIAFNKWMWANAVVRGPWRAVPQSRHPCAPMSSKPLYYHDPQAHFLYRITTRSLVSGRGCQCRRPEPQPVEELMPRGNRILASANSDQHRHWKPRLCMCMNVMTAAHGQARAILCTSAADEAISNPFN